MTWTDYNESIGDLVRAAEEGDTAAAMTVLKMLQQRTDDADPLVRYAARCIKAWGPKFDAHSARAAFGIGGRHAPAAALRVQALASFRRRRAAGAKRADALQAVAKECCRSVEWVELRIDSPTKEEDIAAELLLRLGT
jgi:hypothetical protein